MNVNKSVAVFLDINNLLCVLIYETKEYLGRYLEELEKKDYLVGFMVSCILGDLIRKNNEILAEIEDKESLIKYIDLVRVQTNCIGEYRCGIRINPVVMPGEATRSVCQHIHSVTVKDNKAHDFYFNTVVPKYLSAIDETMEALIKVFYNHRLITCR